MTNRNTFNINDINLADFCPLTLKDISKRRYRPFVHLLDTFDLDEKVYIKDYLTYFPYVLKSILYNSFETNKKKMLDCLDHVKDTNPIQLPFYNETNFYYLFSTPMIVFYFI